MGDSIVIKVSTQELQAASDQVGSALSEMRNSFSVIEQAVEHSEGYWQGEAAQRHRRIYRELQGTVTEILERVQEHREDLLSMARNYENSQEKVLELVADLPSDVIV